VQVPPTRPVEPEPKAPAWLRGALTDRFDWFITSPVLLTLQDGVLLSAEQRDAVLPALEAMGPPPLRPDEIAKAAPPPLGPPALSVKNPSVEVGRVPRGLKRTIRYEVANTGQSALTLSIPHVSCSCFKPAEDFVSVAPGTSHALEVQFDASNLRGKVDRQLRVVTNDPKNREVALKVIGSVEDLFEGPEEIALGKVLAGTSAPFQVVLRSREVDPEAIEVRFSEEGESILALDPPDVTAGDAKKPFTPGQPATRTVNATLRAGERLGRLKARLVLTGTDPATGSPFSRGVTIRATVFDPRVAPGELRFGMVFATAGGDRLEKTLTVQPLAEGEAVAVGDLPPFLTVRERSDAAGKAQFRLAVDRAKSNRAGLREGDVELIFTHQGNTSRRRIPADAVLVPEVGSAVSNR